jgi:hypothetical protein
LTCSTSASSPSSSRRRRATSATTSSSTESNHQAFFPSPVSLLISFGEQESLANKLC